jgi:hypothetical protein
MAKDRLAPGDATSASRERTGTSTNDRTGELKSWNHSKGLVGGNQFS